MVAGMVMPLDNLKAIYERLFRDGVMVAKKDKRPQTKHPEIPGVANLQVLRAMGSLKSRGFVKETFAWRHFYWYLTNEGIVYLREFLHLPPEIVPTPLQRVRRPAATLPIGQRAARVQTIEGPTSYVPKSGRGGMESQEALMQRQEYRRKQLGTEEEPMVSEKTPRFRGRPVTGDQIKPSASWSRDQAQPLVSGVHDYAREQDRNLGQSATRVFHHPSAEIRSTQKSKITEDYKASREAAVIKDTAKKMSARVDLPQLSAVTAITAGAVTASVSPKKAVKAKQIEDMYDKPSEEFITSKSSRDVSLPSEKQVKAIETKNVLEHPVKDDMPKVAEKSYKSVTQKKKSEHSISDEIVPEVLSKSSAQPASVMTSLLAAKPAKEKVIEQKTEVSVKVSQEAVTVKSATDDSQPPEKQEAKSLKTRKTKNVQEHPVKEEIPRVEEKFSVSTTQKVASKDNSRREGGELMEILPKTTAQLPVAVTTEDAVAVTASMSPSKANKERVKEEVVPQSASIMEQAKNVSLHPVKGELPKVEEVVKISVTKKTVTSEVYTESHQTALIESVPATKATVDIKPGQLNDTATRENTVTASISPNKADKENQKDKVKVKVSQDTNTMAQAKNVTQPPSSKKKVEDTKESTEAKTVHPVKDEIPRITEESTSIIHQIPLQVYSKSEERGLHENLPKTAVSEDLPVQFSDTTADTMTSKSTVETEIEKLEKVSVKISQTTNTEEQIKDMSQPSSSKKKKNKKQKAAVTKEEITKVSEKASMSASQSAVPPVESETKSDLEKGEKIQGIKESAMPFVSEKYTEQYDVADTEKPEMNLSQQTAEPPLDGNASVVPPVTQSAAATAKAQKSKKKAQKMSSTEGVKDSDDSSKNKKSVSPKAPEEVQIPADKMSSTVVETGVKMHEHGLKPTPATSAAVVDTQAEDVSIQEDVKAVKQTASLEKGEKIQGIKDKEAAVPFLSEKDPEQNVVFDTVKENNEINFSHQIGEPQMQGNAPSTAATAKAPKSKKKAQKTSSTEEVKDNDDSSKNKKPISPKAPEELQIPAEEMSSTVVETGVKMHEYDFGPTPATSAAVAQTKKVSIQEDVKMVQQTALVKKGTERNDVADTKKPEMNLSQQTVEPPLEGNASVVPPVVLSTAATAKAQKSKQKAQKSASTEGAKDNEDSSKNKKTVSLNAPENVQIPAEKVSSTVVETGVKMREHDFGPTPATTAAVAQTIEVSIQEDVKVVQQTALVKKDTEENVLVVTEKPEMNLSQQTAELQMEEKASVVPPVAQSAAATTKATKSKKKAQKSASTEGAKDNEDSSKNKKPVSLNAPEDVQIPAEKVSSTVETSVKMHEHDFGPTPATTAVVADTQAEDVSIQEDVKTVKQTASLEKCEKIQGIKDKEAAVPFLSEKDPEQNVVVDTVKENNEINLSQQIGEPPLEGNASVMPSVAQSAAATAKAPKSKKKAQKTSSTEGAKDTDDSSKNKKPISPKAPEEVQIPAEKMSSTVVETGVKMHEYDFGPTPATSAAVAQAKEVSIQEQVKVVQQTALVKDTEHNDVADTEKPEMNLSQQTAEPPLDGNASVVPPVVLSTAATAKVPKSKQKAQKTSSTEGAKDNEDSSKNKKPVSLNAPEDVQIPAEKVSSTVVETSVKMHEHDFGPTPATSAAVAQAKEVSIQEQVKVVQQTALVKKDTEENVLVVTEKPEMNLSHQTAELQMEEKASVVPPVAPSAATTAKATKSKKKAQKSASRS
ncbi:enolase-phosphatase E1-like [Hoplias malabaricus]|uniref:enolase-phosphatase E1-like n=1 Tax=Hoplias malabaricus TaxID=27720 RepID=UPI00346303FE